MSENKYVLLTKKQAIAEYNIPVALFDEAIHNNEIAMLGEKGYYDGGRFYIPRFAIERWIDQNTKRPKKRGKQ